MPSPESPAPFLLFTQRLHDAGMRYMISGSVAAIYYGEPRMTNDVDIILHLPRTEVGRLVLPSLASITLAGLSDGQATQLLNADPRLAGLQFKVTLVPVEPIGSAALRRFGYDLFDQVPTTFAPARTKPCITQSLKNSSTLAISSVFRAMCSRPKPGSCRCTCAASAF